MKNRKGTLNMWATGDRIAEEMRRKKVTIMELAEALDVSEVTVSSWRSGTQTPSLSHMVELASYLNVSIDELVAVNDELGNLAA